MFEFVKSTKAAEGKEAMTGVTETAETAETAGPLAMASWTSALMILPEGPVPWRPARETPDVLARFWARGLAKILDPDGFAAAGAETEAAGAATGAATEAGVGAAA